MIKKIIMVFLFLTFMLPFAVAQDCNKDQVGVAINGCVCVEEIDSQGNTKYILDCKENKAIEIDKNVNKDIEIKSYDLTDKCRDDLKKIDQEIIESIKLVDSYNTILENQKKINLEVNNSYVNYKQCLVKKKIENNIEGNTENSSSLITGNVVISNVKDSLENKDRIIQINQIKDQIKNVTGNIVDKTNLIQSNKNYYKTLNDIYLKNKYLLKDMQNSMQLIEDNFSKEQIEDCNQEKTKLKVNLETLENQLNKLNKKLESDEYKKLNELLNKREEIRNKCYSNQIKFDCENKETYYKEIVKIDKKLKNIELKLQTMNYEDNKKEYDNLKKEYKNLLDKKKILNVKKDIFSDSCENLNKFTINCQEQRDILNKLKNQFNKLKNYNDEESVFEIKRQINYLQKKYNETNCTNDYIENIKDDFIHTLKTEIEDEYLESCIKKLMKDDNVSKDKAEYACKVNYKKSKENYKNKIQALEEKIKNQKNLINNLKSQVNEFREKYKNFNKDDRLNYLAENSEIVITDTREKLKGKIIDLEKRLEIIENQDMNSEIKDILINRINKNISSLEESISNLDNITDTKDIKKYINESKQTVINTNLEKEYVRLYSYILNMEKIINKYFSNHPNYDLLKNNFDELKSQVKDDLANDNFDSKSLKTYIKDYKTLKNKIKSYKGGNQTVINTNLEKEYVRLYSYILNMEKIINKYFSNHPNYDLLKNNFDELKSQVKDDLANDNFDSKSLKTYIKDYKTLKNKIKSYKGGN